MKERLDGQVGWFAQDTWSGKTYQEPLAAETQKERTSQPSSKKSSKSQSREPLCLCVPNGGWTKSGCYYAEDGSWSVAWRVHDAQFWGVPQRRKRIALVADFGGLSAPEILFERKGLSGDSERSGAEREETAGAVGGGAYPTVARSLTQRYDGSPCVDRGPNIVMQNAEQSRDSVFCLQGNGIDRADTAGCNGRGWCEDVSYTLNTIDRPAVAFGCDVYNQEITGDIAASLTAASGGTNTSGPKVIAAKEGAVYDARGNGDGKTVCTITGDHQNRVTDYTALCVGNGQANQSVSDKAGALNTMHDQRAVMCFQNTGRGWWNESDVGATIRTPCGGDSTKANLTINNDIVRRLTPLECERLQGYPDGWTDIGEWVDSKGKKHGEADSPRYKALGNSIALPFWQWMAKRISAQYERTPTIASLFDGIGGFPLVFQRCGAVPVWASEIEEFPIAVTKVRFPDESM